MSGGLFDLMEQVNLMLLKGFSAQMRLILGSNAGYFSMTRGVLRSNLMCLDGIAWNLSQERGPFQYQTDII